MCTERMRHQGESAAVDTAQPLLTGMERNSGIWEYTLEQWCQPRKENLRPSCPSPGNPLIWRSPAAAPSHGGRKGKRQKKNQNPTNIDKSLSASAQTFQLELSNPLEKAIPSWAAAIGKT